MTTLLDANNLEPPSKTRRYIITAVAFVVIVSLGGWYLFRFFPERRTMGRFMDTLVAGNFEQAYRIWNSHGSYSYKDFLGDWATTGYYGPIQSYRIQSVEEPPNGATGVIVTVTVSPVHPFPAEQDPQSSRNREVRLWVERSDQSISFPPRGSNDAHLRSAVIYDPAM